ncbi:DUF554 domain-containing protein [Synechococcus sp. W55.1]|uniref:DUF554 domain-containing protein n=1 Tax=Synechococcus sp. W55.1 TaxID=2964512 RepID=UPI0039C2242A
MAPPGTGTLVNTLAILAGSGLGWGVGSRLPQRMSQTLLQAMGSLVLVLGIQMALTLGSAAQAVTVLVALMSGAVLGEWIDIEAAFERIGQALEKQVSRWLGPNPITHAFVTTSILFVVGPMTLLGSIQDGLGDPSLLLVKAALDGIATLAFTASLGWGTLFSAVPVLLVQGGVALLARQLQPLLRPDLIAALEATGGILILGIGLNLLGLARLRVANLLPALVIVELLVGFFPVWDLHF